MPRTQNSLNTHTVELLTTVKNLAKQNTSVNKISQETGLHRNTVTKLLCGDDTIKIVEENKYVNES